MCTFSLLVSELLAKFPGVIAVTRFIVQLKLFVVRTTYVVDLSGKRWLVLQLPLFVVLDVTHGEVDIGEAGVVTLVGYGWILLRKWTNCAGI